MCTEPLEQPTPPTIPEPPTRKTFQWAPPHEQVPDFKLLYTLRAEVPDWHADNAHRVLASTWQGPLIAVDVGERKLALRPFRDPYSKGGEVLVHRRVRRGELLHLPLGTVSNRGGGGVHDAIPSEWTVYHRAETGLGKAVEICTQELWDSLEQHDGSGRMPLPTFKAAAAQGAAGIAHLHEHGLVHRECQAGLLSTAKGCHQGAWLRACASLDPVVMQQQWVQPVAVFGCLRICCLHSAVVTHKQRLQALTAASPVWRHNIQ